MYVCYKCNKCGLEFIIPIFYVKKMEAENRYIACNFGHRNIREIGRYEGIKDCFKQDIYGKSKEK